MAANRWNRAYRNELHHAHKQLLCVHTAHPFASLTIVSLRGAASAAVGAAAGAGAVDAAGAGAACGIACKIQVIVESPANMERRSE